MSTGIRLQSDATLIQRLRQMNWGLVFLLTFIACLGFMALYSAAGGNINPWASRQMARFAIGMAGMMIAAMIDVRWWYRLAYPIYGVVFLMLIAVDIIGHIGMGAQRWINLGFIQIQPSELMKIAVVMALARYFHGISGDDAKRLRFLAVPALIILAPVGLVMMQPDLGTAMTIIMGGGAMFFLGGAPLWLFIGGIAAAVCSMPVAWHFLHDYQKKRILIFMDPESDPLGSGYHIMQSKIALGSGGIEGKGFLKGTQSHLNFLPEKQTDFIFTLWSEEWGLLGGLLVIILFSLTFLYGGLIALRCRHMFGRLLAFGLMVNFSLYVFVNTAMVMGLIPVVGIPLPLFSYGGTAMMAVLGGFGLIMSCNVYRDAKLPRMQGM